MSGIDDTDWKARWQQAPVNWEALYRRSCGERLSWIGSLSRLLTDRLLAGL